MKQYLLLLALAAAALAHSPLRFDNFQVHRVTPQSLHQLNVLKTIEESGNGYSFWTDVSGIGKPVDIMVPPHMKYDFEDLVKFKHLKSELWIENVQTLVDRQMPVAVNRSATFNWNAYQTLDQIYDWLSSLRALYPVVEVIEGGQSYEGRKILGVKISYGPDRKAVLIEGGIHAREWIAPATVTYITNELLTSTDPNVRAVAEGHDWYIFPSVNPDGYVYTHKSNRLWRKTRKPYGLCVGADPNRNWGYKWMNGGASSSACMDTHAGSHAFSEIETKSLSEFIKTIGKDVEIYLGFHSYSQLLLIPYGHNGLEVPENNQEMHEVGKKAMDVLAKRYGTRYTVGNIPNVIYVASGGSSDWVLSEFKNIRLAYTYELRDTGRYGFLLPPEQIIPTGEETLDSIVSIVEQAKQLRGR